ncbi:MAG: dihydrolipoyl dehydrogenase [Sandaracinaceae bacterium]
MSERSVDVAIIGAGTAGLGARREAEKAGKSYVLIESGPYGTTCARVGCMPSKLLIAAAEAAHEIKKAPMFGVHPGEIRIDGKAVMDRVKRERDRFVGFVVAGTERIDAENRLMGHAKFVSPGVLDVGGHTTVHAKTVVIATGSAPWVPPPFSDLGDRVDLNDDVFEWDDLPKSVAVVGTGIIGLELGQALHRLGVEVAFFNPFEVLGPFSDDAVKQSVRDVLGAELELHVGIDRDIEAKRVEEGVAISFTENGERQTRVFQRVLAAAGRRPNLPGLALENAGIELDDKGRPVGWRPDTCQIGDSSVFMAGDVSGHRPLLHEASDEGHIAGRNAATFPDVQADTRRTSLAIAFTSPQMAIVGKSHEELEPGTFSVGEIDYGDQGRARVMGLNAGLVRIYANNADCRIIGAEMFGPRVEHMAQMLANAIHVGETVSSMLGMPFYHPVVEEGLRTALRQVGEKLDAVGGCRGQDTADCPGA